MKITRKSPFSGKINTMDLNITDAQIRDYNQGELIQYAFSNLTANEREFYKTGITAEEWDSMSEGEDA